MPVNEKAIKAFTAMIKHGYGHRRSSNMPGRKTQEFVEEAETLIAEFAGGARAMFYYDGGVANGLSILSMGRQAKERNRKHIISSPVEHSSVNTALKMLRGEGFSITILPIDNDGRINPESLKDAMNDETGLVTIAWASSISGIIQPVEELSAIAHSNGALFHSDACNAAGKIEIDLSSTDIDAITVCSQKIGGPPGAAAVVITDSDPWLMSNAPEFSCMMNIPGISGMIAAIDIINTGIVPRARIVNQLRTDLFNGLDYNGIKYSIIGNCTDNLLPGTALLSMRKAPDRFHARLEDANIVLPSHSTSERLAYLESTGRDISNPDRYLGFSISPENNIVDIEHFIRVVSDISFDSKR